jgi:hypothetical protein
VSYRDRFDLLLRLRLGILPRQLRAALLGSGDLVLWRDPALGIAWPVSAEEALISDKDREHPALSLLPRFFECGPTVPPRHQGS